MIYREISKLCKTFSTQYPVITLTGPRQSGKTTLSRNLFPDKAYINLEQPDQRRLVLEDPRGFLKQYPDGAILDEIQRTPELPSYIQGIVDDNDKTGMFILTGSQQLEISQSISQSLAGRTAMVKLLPLSTKELFSYKKYESIDELILKGFYPRLHVRSIEPCQFYSHYFETYIERDLRQLSQIENLEIFAKCVRLLAGRVGQLVNFNSISNDLGVSQPTIKKWISLLQASYIIFLLPPFYRNIGKRLIKTPKVYFYDIGLVCFLLGIEEQSQLVQHPLRGNLFENFVIIEYLKKRYSAGKQSNLYFFRDRTGNEVDLILEKGQKLIPIEIKSAATISSDFKKGLNLFKKLFPNEVSEGYVIYSGDSAHTANEISYLPWNELVNIH